MERVYCCELMQRWVSDPRGANAPPRRIVYEEYDMPPEGPQETTTWINEALDNDETVLIHHDQYDDFGIMARGKWRGCYVGINYCPWCGSDLCSNEELSGKIIHEFDERFTAFDQRTMTLEHIRADYGISFLAEQAGIEDAKEMSIIEILIRLQGKYFTDARYSDYPGRAEIDFDKAWAPRELAEIAHYCAEHGPTNPAVALWKLLCVAEQPAVWALAMLDLAAHDIPYLHNIYFDLRDDEPIVVIEASPLSGRRELKKMVDEIRSLTASLPGYTPTDDSDMGLSDDIKAYNKLARHTGFRADESDIEEGVLRYSLPPYYRDDVKRYLQERDKPEE